MLSLSLSEIAAITGGELHGSQAIVKGLSTDSRTIARDMLFCAVSGPSFDGNDFLEDAASRGAAASLSTRAAIGMPSVVVDDSLRALHVLMTEWRSRFAPMCVGVTGSNGKTTVKEMLARILEERGRVLSTAGNLNNHIGVPLTLARLDDSHRYMVVEMGANHRGEIASLAQMARPVVGVITLVAPAHLEGFGSVQGVARAKGEMIEALPEDGTAVVNGDGDFQPLWRELAGSRRMLRFGFGHDVDVRVEQRAVTEGSIVRLRTASGAHEFLLPLHGRHNASNAAAAAAAALALDFDLDTVVSGLGRMQPVRGRLTPLVGALGLRIFDDTYNANPSSLEAALEVLATSPGPRWLVLGEMAELGDDAEGAHVEAGKLARASGVERLWCTGALCEHTARAFGAGAEHFASTEALTAELLGAIDECKAVLVKGSRSAGMERVVAALTALRTEDSPVCC